MMNFWLNGELETARKKYEGWIKNGKNSNVSPYGYWGFFSEFPEYEKYRMKLEFRMDPLKVFILPEDHWEKQCRLAQHKLPSHRISPAIDIPQEDRIELPDNWENIRLLTTTTEIDGKTVAVTGKEPVYVTKKTRIINLGQFFKEEGQTEAEGWLHRLTPFAHEGNSYYGPVILEREPNKILFKKHKHSILLDRLHDTVSDNPVHYAVYGSNQ